MLDLLFGGAPGDRQGFIHKRIFRGIKGAVGGILGGPAGIVGGGIGGFFDTPGGPKPSVPGRPFGPVGPPTCDPGFTFSGGRCVHPAFKPRSPKIPSTFGPPPFVGPHPRPTGPPPTGNGAQAEQLTLGGDAELGRFGAGINPAFFSQQTRRCPRGMVLGAPEADGESLCYNRRDLSNKERMWPQGRRPLLTGGDMRCISVASSAAKKLQRKQKQLESMGMLKKPSRRGPPRLAAGHEAVVRHG